MTPSNLLGGLFFVSGLAPLIYEVVKAQPRTAHDWAFVALVAIGALLIDPKDVGQAIGSLVSALKGVLPGKGE